jgi:hypothetical protein
LLAHFLWPAIAAAAVVGTVAAAAELSTDAERTYRELQKAKDTKSQLLAERWYNLIRQQDWNDATGKHKTLAKYVEHDPNLTWVKLRVIQGTGAKRVVKDVTIPLEKLSKACQSRVRQIAFLQERVADAAQEAGKQADAAGSAEDMQAVAESRDEQGGERGYGRPPIDDSAANPPPVAPAAAASAPLPPLPVLLPPLPTDPALALFGRSTPQPPEPAEREEQQSADPSSAPAAAESAEPPVADPSRGRAAAYGATADPPPPPESDP